MIKYLNKVDNETLQKACILFKNQRNRDIGDILRIAMKSELTTNPWNREAYCNINTTKYL